MKIYIKKGNKSENDNIIFIDTDTNDYVNLMDLAFLVNQIAINELKIMKDKKLDREKYFWFKNLINISINDAERDIDWKKLDKEKLSFLKEYPFFISEKTLDKFFEDLKND